MQTAVPTMPGLAKIPSPALIFRKDVIEANLDRVVAMAGQADKLRPHVKTHKTCEIVQMGIARGIFKHKCATIAEAELLARAGAADVLIAYPLVGPNIDRLCRLIATFPQTSFAVLVDDLGIAQETNDALFSENRPVRIIVDIDVGQHRTGIPIASAEAFVHELIGLKHLYFDGIHVYDGHNRASAFHERDQAADTFLAPVLDFRERLSQQGIEFARLICGGTPTFPVYARKNIPGLECSPGTFVLHDAGYGEKYEDLRGFEAAAFVLTRIVSMPGGHRLTLDCGTKAIASDPPAGDRVRLPGLGAFQAVGHNEEHFIVEVEDAARFTIGQEFLALPTHVCPTVALYPHAEIFAAGQHMGTWPIAARNRMISI
jgi:D-threonine aldolase